MLRIWHRITGAWIRHGPAKFARLLLKNAVFLVPELIKNARLRTERSQFDRDLGIDTDGRRWIGELDVDPNAESTRDARWYAPSAISVFERALGTLRIDASEFTFIDYGCGKGRVLILAARLPFRSVIGVEFSEPLHKIAEENISRAKDRIALASPDIRSICCDAAVFDPPEGPLICYMANPFGAVILKRVLEKLENSLAAAPRPVFIVYTYPTHPDVIAKSASFEMIEKNSDFCIFRSKVSGLAQKSPAS